MDLRRKRQLVQGVAFFIIRSSAVVIGVALAIMLGFIFIRGYKAISWTFLTQPPMEAMTKGGIFPAIVGTCYLTLGAILIAFPQISLFLPNLMR